ncbi:hypothetical protein APT56_20630 [Achromobacter denitrificans]|uniref:Uncharacterized protein n=1 Tax=Achromobacter ruhlandii TaxID=72557 RepID=A0A2M9GYX4_9BURK|nr:DUF1120 domain-containing protein [Achromobacter ruhlandii]ALX85409.1 hypothetical protein APT56_20630 [Achromobacter denitrificans]PJM69786.1 DUF1120 domain-containing protein [Achromobacter ruhlandii]CAB3868634.1 hypothetical protein LMG3328_02664 [Achromobacter ruhlandii]
MKHHTSKLLSALLACAASTSVMAQAAAPQAAAPSFKINVTGTIAPGSCTPASGALTFDMKSINPKSLNNDKLTMLSAISNTIKITCTADTAIALNVTGYTKAPTAFGSNVNDHPAGMSTYEVSLYDLVNPADNNSRVGVFGMQFRDFTYTGGGSGSVASKAEIIKSDDKNSWSNNTSSPNGWDTAQLKKDGSNFISFADPKANTTPVLASVFEGKLVLAPTILAKKDLKLTGDLKFEGGATITLNYL